MQFWRRKHFWLDVCILGACLLLSAWLVYEYVSSERFFYLWDYGAYQEYAVRFAADLFQDPAGALLRLWLSTSRNYNDYFALPLSFIVHWFDGSRFGYILGVTLIYQLPYVVTLGAIAAQLVQENRWLVFWSTIFIALLTPMAWAPTLRGYPDVAAAWMVALAILVYLRDTDLRRWQTAAGTGSLLAAAALLRRHFGYDVLAFYGVLLAQVIFVLICKIRKKDPKIGEYWMGRVRWIGLSGAALLLTLILFGAPFLVKVLLNRYTSLYASYAVSPIVALQAYLEYFSWLIWGLVILGYGVGLWRGTVRRPAAIFLCAFFVVNLVLWSIVVRNAATHYTLHLSTFIILGLSTWFWSIWRWAHKPARSVLLILSALFVFANLVFALSSIPVSSSLQPLFSKAYPPLVRKDYAEVERLVRYLHDRAAPGEAIYVVDSSTQMNFSILRQAEQAVYATQELNILTVPEVDSRDFYPLEMLMQAEYVLVSQPFQYHLALEEQHISLWVYETFLGESGISRDFQKLPEVFFLENGVVLHIYQRSRPTSVAAAVNAFGQMVDFIGQRPGKQPDWVVLRGIEQVSLSKTDAVYRIHLHLTGQEKTPSEAVLLYVEKIKGGVDIKGEWAFEGSACPDLRLRFDWMDSGGTVLQSWQEEWSAGIMRADFTAQFNNLLDEYALLSIQTSRPAFSLSNCDLSISFALNSRP